MRAFFRIPLILALILSFSGLFFSSCNKATEFQLEKIDSLEYLLNESKSALNLDTGEIKKRSSAMRGAMGQIQRYYKGGYTEDLARDMDVYRGIQKIYSRFLEAYPVISAEYKELDQQWRDLRYSSKKGKFTDEEFTAYYRREQADILKNAENIRIYVQPVYESEPFYKKIQPRVDSMLTLSPRTE